MSRSRSPARARLPRDAREILFVDGVERQHEAGRLVDARAQQSRDSRALAGLREVVRERIDVAGQCALVEQHLGHILERRQYVAGWKPKPRRQRIDERACRIDRRAARNTRIRNETIVAPQRLAVDAPEHAERPAWQRLAWVPLALPEMQHAAARELRLQPQQQ